jgi:hypothetical protein
MEEPGPAFWRRPKGIGRIFPPSARIDLAQAPILVFPGLRPPPRGRCFTWNRFTPAALQTFTRRLTTLQARFVFSLPRGGPPPGGERATNPHGSAN